jgi:hypothetical protein
VAFLCTPTDCHVIPKAAYEAAKENYNNRTLFQSLFGGLLGEWWWWWLVVVVVFVVHV